jgi:predicted RNA-binding Zn-ribbon protein involved in translation (DUF1610 family)
MSNDVIFWTQIISLLGFSVVLFGLYRLLVETKESTIQLLKENIASLKEQLTEAKSKTPDILAQNLSSRVKLLDGELERLSKDQSSSREQILEKENELRSAQQEKDDLLKQLAYAQTLLTEFSCPDCGALLARREFASESVEYQGRELDIDHEYTEYECGYAVTDGKQVSQCKQNRGIRERLHKPPGHVLGANLIA